MKKATTNKQKQVKLQFSKSVNRFTTYNYGRNVGNSQK